MAHDRHRKAIVAAQCESEGPLTKRMRQRDGADRPVLDRAIRVATSLVSEAKTERRSWRIPRSSSGGGTRTGTDTSARRQQLDSPSSARRLSAHSDAAPA